tara:strand:- start:1164 stop:1496 length:333 start_codon:yes stop_codon:yes gene_type:complete
MDEEVKIKIDLIKVIYEALLPVHYKLNSLLKDTMLDIFFMSEPEKASLLEFCACASTLKILFESYFERAENLGVEEISLPRNEYISILSMSKSVEAATRVSFANTGIWEN